MASTTEVVDENKTNEYDKKNENDVSSSEEEEKLNHFENNNDFENNLFSYLVNMNKDQKNLICSPFSILAAMTLCMLGSANNTLKQMLNVLYPNIKNKELTFTNSQQITATLINLCKSYNKRYEKKDYYKILGVNKEATPQQIRKAWKTNFKKWYRRDKSNELEDVAKMAEEKVNDICAAFNILSIPQRKKKYDDGEDVTKFISNDKHPMIKIANKIFISNCYKIKDQYIASFGVDVIETFDAHNAVKAAQLVNSWCAKNTNNMIQKIVNSNNMENAMIIVANAIYFNGKFVTPFCKDKTKHNIAFYDGKDRKKEISKVTMMESTTEQHFFLEKLNGKYDLVKLAYKDSKISLILVINNYTNKNERLLTTRDISSIKNWRKCKCNLYVPKFKYEYEIELSGVLQKHGISDAFTGNVADFSNMTEANDIHIDLVLHKAVIDVNEEGTEAAAFTAVRVTRSIHPPTPTIRFDHPFIFYIFDEDKQVTLFCGVFVGM